MKVNFFSTTLLLLFGLFFIKSCDTRQKEVLKGTWSVVKIEAQFDEQRANPMMLNQVLALEKQTQLQFLNDSVLQLISEEEQTSYTVRIQSDGQIFISPGRDSLSGSESLFGQIHNGIIRRLSSTPIGNVVLYFKKAK
jgi:hypothetical protein